jgi:hypothetical protein
VEVYVDDGKLDFAEAKQIADRAARNLDPQPMLLAWFERNTGEHSPRVECCGDDKPAWLVYAESRGGNLVIQLNDGEYQFVFRVEEESVRTEMR